MSPLVPLAVSGALELIKLGADIFETWQSNPNNQAELDARWEKMKAQRDAAISAWEASKQANGQD